MSNEKEVTVKEQFELCSSARRNCADQDEALRKMFLRDLDKKISRILRAYNEGTDSDTPNLETKEHWTFYFTVRQEQWKKGSSAKEIVGGFTVMLDLNDQDLYDVVIIPSVQERSPKAKDGQIVGTLKDQQSYDGIIELIGRSVFQQIFVQGPITLQAPNPPAAAEPASTLAPA